MTKYTQKKSFSIFQKFLKNQKKELQMHLLNFIEQINEQDHFFEKLVKFIIDGNITKDHEELKSFLILVYNISYYHHRNVDFFQKIERILLFLKEDIKSNFLNIEIFKIFQYHKRIIVFLIHNQYMV